MSPEAIELLDTAIKIGLGAVIAATSTYFLTRYNHRADIKKEFFKRYFDTIELVSNSADLYYQKWEGFTCSVGGVSANTVEKNIAPSQEEWDFISKADDELVITGDNKITAVSRLRLLKINNVANILEESYNIERELRNKVMFDNEIPTLSQLEGFETKMENNKKEFYDLLCLYYNVEEFSI